LSDIFNFTTGSQPLLISVPHAGTRVPDAITRRFTPAAQSLPDTDWYVDRLFPWARAVGVSLISANYSRYVIDLNRPPDDAALYPGKTPGLIPLETFEGNKIYAGEEPGPAEATQRLEQFWKPYHSSIIREMSRMHSEYGFAILLDAHSIHSRVPLLFDGVLPDLNLGSYEGRSAAKDLVKPVMAAITGQQHYSHVLDGRFKGGYITRHYGRPRHGYHAIQLEMSQSMYMDEKKLRFEPELAEPLQQFLKGLVGKALEWKPGDE
jgi:N-formylglutamate deformylase